MVVNKSFFNRPADKVAIDLLGKKIIRIYRGKAISGIITETEAYVGPQDKASHASRGLTSRNRPMFGPPGTIYVYLVYGMHWMFNFVTGREGYPAAVLIRGIKGINGPGKVTNFLRIDKGLNGRSVGRKTGLWIVDEGIRIRRSQIKKGPRIGIHYAGKWATKHYRFYLDTF